MKIMTFSGILQPYTFFFSRLSFFLSFVYLVEGKENLKTQSSLSDLPYLILRVSLSWAATPLLPPGQPGTGMLVLSSRKEPSTERPENLLTCHQCYSLHQWNRALLFQMQRFLQLSCSPKIITGSLHISVLQSVPVTAPLS